MVDRSGDRRDICVITVLRVFFSFDTPGTLLDLINKSDFIVFYVTYVINQESNT